MQCPNCGQKLPEGATVCPSCGAPVSPAAPPAPSVSPAPLSPGIAPAVQPIAASSRPATSGLSTASPILAFLAILCVVLTVVLSYGLGTRVIEQLGSDFTPAEVQRLAADPAFQSSAIAVVAALAFSQLLALAGLILGIVGVSQEGKRPTQSGKALGIVGIILSLLPLLCCVTLVLLYLAGAGMR